MIALTISAGITVKTHGKNLNFLLKTNSTAINNNRTTDTSCIITVLNLFFINTALTLKRRHNLLFFLPILIITFEKPVQTDSHTAMLSSLTLVLITVCATNRMVIKYPELYGMLSYIAVHMHNRAQEAFSIKGIPGVYALSKVYFFGTKATVIYSLGIIISILLINNPITYRNPD